MADEEKTTEQNTEQAEQQEQDKPKYPNTVTVEQIGPCRKKVTVEIPAEVVKESLEEQYRQLRRDAVVPGFRRGRAPLRLLEKRFGTDVGTQVKLKLLADASEAALKDNKIDSLRYPDIDHEKIELPDSGPMRFEFEVEVRPEIDLPELEGIEVEKTAVQVTDEQLDGEITAMRRHAGLWIPKESNTVEPDDRIVADIILKIEGVEEHQKQGNIEISVQDNAFAGPVPVENLSELLTGAKPGDRRTTSITVPATFYNEQYRGKNIEVDITVKEVKRLVPAELNEEFYRRFGVENEQELGEGIRRLRTTQAERQARSTMAEQVYRYLLDNTKFDLPTNVVADQSTRLLQRQYTGMLMQGMTKEQVEQNMESLRAGSEQQAKEQLRQFFIMDKVADKFQVSVSEEEINGYIAQVAASRGRRPEKMREELTRDGSLAEFVIQIRDQKCVEKILETAKIKEVEPQQESAKKEKKSASKTSHKTAKAQTEPVSDEEKAPETKKKAAKSKKDTGEKED